MSEESGGTGDELQARLMTWLEDSGRALELRVSRSFRMMPEVYRIEQSPQYEDRETQKIREGDVLSVFRWRTVERLVALELAIECKSGRDHPWVAFYDGKTGTPLNVNYWARLTADRWVLDDVGRFVDEWTGQSRVSSHRVATHVVSAFGKEGHNHAVSAAQQAVSFARYRAERVPVRYEGDPKDVPAATAVVPVVVTQAPLFECELQAGGAVTLTPTDRFDMWVHQGGRRYRVYVRSEAGLADFAGGCATVSQRAGSPF